MPAAVYPSPRLLALRAKLSIAASGSRRGPLRVNKQTTALPPRAGRRRSPGGIRGNTYETVRDVQLTGLI